MPVPACPLHGGSGSWVICTHPFLPFRGKPGASTAPCCPPTQRTLPRAAHSLCPSTPLQMPLAGAWGTGSLSRRVLLPRGSWGSCSRSCGSQSQGPCAPGQLLGERGGGPAVADGGPKRRQAEGPQVLSSFSGHGHCWVRPSASLREKAGKCGLG